MKRRNGHGTGEASRPPHSVPDRSGVWIPGSIWNDYNLSLVDKVLLADITSMVENGLTYFKTNERIANDLQCSIATAKRSLSKLADDGYILIHYEPTRTIEVAQNEPAQNELGGSSKCTATRVKMSRTPAQIEPHTNTENKPMKKTDTKPLVMPFPDADFAEAWELWKTERRARKMRAYTALGEQTQLHRLQKISNNDSRTAIDVIHQSIAQGWQGLFPLKSNSTGTAPRRIDTDKLADYIRNGAG